MPPAAQHGRGSVCPYQPAVAISQDMLSYEPGEMRRYGFSGPAATDPAALHSGQHAQAGGRRDLSDRVRAQSHSVGDGPLAALLIIPHGLGAGFRRAVPANHWPQLRERPIRCLYVSNAAMYKHQWNVVRAIGALRKRGVDVSLALAGGGSGRAQSLLYCTIEK